MANPTTNFGWQMPTSTDLVTDLPADFEVFGQAVDTALVDLKGGTTGQVLSKASGTDMDFAWVAQDDSNAIQNAIVDAKGDLIAASAADTPARLAVGTDYGWLKADSTQSTGLAWDNSSWTSYTPTVSAGSGTFTSASAVGYYKRIGKVCVVHFAVTIVTNGTAGTNVQFTLPFAGGGTNNQGVWREVQSTGSCGIVSDNGTTGVLRTFTNTYPGADSRIFSGSLIYEVS
jgi:hypothetical protein